MNNDDQPVRGDDDMTEPTQSEREAIAELDDVLADPALWAQPPAALQEQIVAAIAEAKASGPPRRRRYAIAGTAAAVLLTGAVVIGLNPGSNPQIAAVQYTGALTGSSLEPGASGEVTLTKTESGWEIELDATGLPRRSDGTYYEAWLKSADGNLVPVGTFNAGKDVTLWSGVPPTSHPSFTITRQVADGNPASTGQVVLSGTTKPSD